jgi:hypothetical protein
MEKKSNEKDKDYFSELKAETKKDLKELKNVLSEREKTEQKIIWEKCNLMSQK